MAMEFSTTQEDSATVNVLVYGRSGIGKTCLITTCPKPIIISSEKGLMSIAKSNIPVLKIKTLDDLQEAYDYVYKHRKKYKTVCLDSISDIAEAVLTDMKKRTKHAMQAYGELYDRVSEAIRDFRDLPLNTYFIAKLMYKDNAAGIECARPSMPGKALTGQLPYFFDEVFCLRIKGDDDDDDEAGYRYLQTAPDMAYDAKDRAGVLRKEEEPDLGKVFKKIKKHLKDK